MKPLHRKLAISALAACAAVVVGAQERGTPEPADAGAIIVPPPTDPEALRKAPQGVDPEMAVPPAADERKPERVPQRQKSKQDDCRGRADLCRQDAAK